ncbi:MAG: nicotinate-nucleotide adenylyltransferase [Pseudomonadota bacterium]
MFAASPSPSAVGLLGGSFNPAHGGHRELSLAALRWIGLDAVWWLVSPGSPLKDDRDYAPYPVRLSVARAMAAHERIVVSNYEDRQNLRYTVDTLDALISDYPAMRFVWLMGADGLRDFHLWRDWRRIAELAPMAVFSRPGATDDALTSEAGAALATFRIETTGEPGGGAGLIGAEPPAWALFEDLDNPLSSSALRQTAAARSSDSQ